MEIDFQKFQNYLVRKDKKNPDYRPLTSAPYTRPRNMSTLECIQNHNIFKKSQKIGFTMRMPSKERNTPTQFQKLSKQRLKSDSLYDPLVLEQKMIKLRMTNDLGVKNLLLRRYNHGKSKDKLHIKQLLLGDKSVGNGGEDENKQSKYLHQKKKLRVVKGKANSYKLKMNTLANNESTIHRGVYEQTAQMNVGVVGTRIL